MVEVATTVEGDEFDAFGFGFFHNFFCFVNAAGGFVIRRGWFVKKGLPEGSGVV